jgi:lipoate-protein ligase A
MRGYRVWADPTLRAGWHNMALDRALLERAQRGERWLRLYAWEPTLSFGRHEPVARRYDAERIAALGVATVRRPTGGRAVWHADELTYAAAAPCADLGSLRDAYVALHRLLRDAIRALGAAAELAPTIRQPALDAGACFAQPAGGEVVIEGRKVVGSAQLREGTAFLQHGSVLLAGDQSLVAAVTRGAAAADGSVSLGRALGRHVSWEETAAVVLAAVAARWGPPLEPVPPTELLLRAEELGPQFRSERWTWVGAATA